MRDARMDEADVLLQDIQRQQREHAAALEEVRNRTNNAAGVHGLEVLQKQLAQQAELEATSFMAGWDPRTMGDEVHYVLSKLNVELSDLEDRPIMASLLAIRGYDADMMYTGSCRMDEAMCHWSEANFTRFDGKTAVEEYAALSKGKKFVKPAAGMSLGATAVSRAVPKAPVGGWKEVDTIAAWQVAATSKAEYLGLAGKGAEAVQLIEYVSSFVKLYKHSDVFTDLVGERQWTVARECDVVIRRLFKAAGRVSWVVTREDKDLQAIFAEYSLRARKASVFKAPPGGGGGGKPAAPTFQAPAPKASGGIAPPKNIEECFAKGWDKLRCKADGNRPYCIKCLFNKCNNPSADKSKPNKSGGCKGSRGGTFSHFCVRCEKLHAGGQFEGGGKCSGTPLR